MNQISQPIKLTSFNPAYANVEKRTLYIKFVGLQIS